MNALRVAAGVASLTLCLGACGDGGSPSTANPYDVVTLTHADGGEAARVQGLRVTKDGDVQALVESGHCIAPSRLGVEESTDAVTLSAYTTSTSDGSCVSSIVPVFVRVDLNEPLGDRRVVDASNGQEVRVVDCGTEPKRPLCDPSETG